MHTDDDAQARHTVAPSDADEAERQANGEEQQEALEEVDFTPTLQSGIEMLQQRTEDLTAKIDDLTEQGCLFLDQLKEEFLRKMQEARTSVDTYAMMQGQEWAETSATTIELQNRLQAARQLVGHLEEGFGAID